MRHIDIQFLSKFISSPVVEIPSITMPMIANIHLYFLRQEHPQTASCREWMKSQWLIRSPTQINRYGQRTSAKVLL